MKRMLMAIGSIIDLFGTMYKSRDTKKTDAEAIYDDFCAIGQDMAGVFSLPESTVREMKEINKNGNSALLSKRIGWTLFYG